MAHRFRWAIFRRVPYCARLHTGGDGRHGEGGETWPTSRRARISGATRDKLAASLKKKYENGASIRALAESTGRSYGFVRRVLTEAGVRLRGVNPQSVPQGARMTAKRLLDDVAPERLDEAIELLRSLVAASHEPQSRRTFRSQGLGHAEHDLGVRAKDIVRRELGDGKKPA
jgi:hypothetical protein